MRQHEAAWQAGAGPGRLFRCTSGISEMAYQQSAMFRSCSFLVNGSRTPSFDQRQTGPDAFVYSGSTEETFLEASQVISTSAEPCGCFLNHKSDLARPTSLRELSVLIEP